MENADFLTKQIITYIGNKRALLPFIGRGVVAAQRKLGRKKLKMFDLFSGSGIVARHFKQYASSLFVNDLEKYAALTSECYLSNKSDLDIPHLREIYTGLVAGMEESRLRGRLVTELYAPKDDGNIKPRERVFYTRRNAMYIDTARELIEGVPEKERKFFLAPLLAEASVHSNTSGVFKGFYKNRETGIGQFGGRGRDALPRITGAIALPFPVFSNFNCEVRVFNGDSNEVVKTVPEVDVAYVDPPYNQHPYGSNYFMLNLILENKRPQNVSPVSGIPANWNRSAYNKRRAAFGALKKLCENLRAKYVLLSFNSEGFISLQEMKNMLKSIGAIRVMETPYNTFRGCRNLSARNIHTTEYLFLLEK